jgi:O-antigen/teichoic acid export membrane protein
VTRGALRPDDPTPSTIQGEFDTLASPTAGGAAIRGGALRVTGYLVGVLLTVLSAAVLFRYLGPEEAGKYVTVLAIVAIVGSVFDGGLHSLAIREASVRKGADRSEVIDDLLGMRLVLGVVAILLASVFAAVLGYEPSLVLGTALASVGLVLWSTHLILAAPLVARLRLGWVTAIDLFRNAGAVVLILAGVWAGLGLIAFLTVPIPVAVAAVVWTAVLVRRQVSLRPSFRVDAWRVLLRDVVPYALATAAGLLYFRVAVVLLSLVASEHETGLYAAAFRTVEVLLIVPQLAVSTVLPIFAHAASQDRDRLTFGVDRTFRTAAVFGGGIAVVLALGAPFAIAVVAGPDFDGAADMLRVQALGLGVALVTSVFTYALLSLRMHRELLVANVAALGVSVMLTLSLGSAWGGIGAATATAIAEVCLVGGAVWLLVRKHPALSPAWSFLLRVVAAGLIAGALALIPLPSLVLAVAGAVVYAAVALALRAVPEELLVELGRIRQLRSARS